MRMRSVVVVYKQGALYYGSARGTFGGGYSGGFAGETAEEAALFAIREYLRYSTSPEGCDVVLPSEVRSQLPRRILNRIESSL